MPARQMTSTVELTVHGKWDAQDVVNVFHYKYPGTITNAMLVALVDDWYTYVMPKWLDASSEEYTLSYIKAKDLNIIDGIEYEAFAFGTPHGTLTGNISQSEGAAIISWHTGRSGRSYRGRTYMGPLWAGAVDADGLVSGMLSVLQTLATELLTQVLGEVFEFAVGSALHHLSTAITGFSLDAIIGTQTRRIVSRGS